jgi:hypothetical protein
MMSTRARVLAVFCIGVAACTTQPVETPTDQFWNRLSSLCDKAFEGAVVEAPPGDSTFANKTLTMHVRECSDSVVRVPFHVGEDRSRTWVLTRTTHGIRLKHDHRHADGQPDSVTQYGGDSRAPIMSSRAEFPADSFTKALIPAAATNVWTVEVDTAQSKFAYALRREGTTRRFRVEFDLSRPVAAPPAPWGSR